MKVRISAREFDLNLDSFPFLTKNKTDTINLNSIFFSFRQVYRKGMLMKCLSIVSVILSTLPFFFAPEKRKEKIMSPYIENLPAAVCVLSFIYLT